MRDYQRRQPLRLDSLWQSQVRRNFESIRGLVLHRLHGRQRFPRQPLAHAILLGELMRRAIEQVRLTRLRIAVRTHQPQAFVEASRSNANLFVRQFLAEPLKVSFHGFVFEISPGAVIQVRRHRQLVRGLRKHRRSKIHSLEGIRFHGLDLCGLRIKQHQPGQVHIVALVRFHVHAFAVFVETHRPATLENPAHIDLLESIRVRTQDFLVAVIRHALGQPQLTIQIKEPPGDPLRVFPHQRLLARGNLQLVEVVPSLIAVIQSDVHHVGVALGHGIRNHPHAF